MSLDPGSINPQSGDFTNADCMAKDIFDAMNSLMPLPELPANILDEVQRKQRQLAVAISKGVINYLKRHGSDSFSIQTTVTPTSACTVNATLTID